MALRTRAKETVQVEFREVNASGVFLAQTEVNQKNSMFLLRQNGFRPLTYQEAIVKIDQNPELKEQLKGKWFYLDDKGSQKWLYPDGKDFQLSEYYTFNDKGELTQGKGDIEKNVYVWKGSRSLLLLVLTDGDARDLGRRFFFIALSGPEFVVGAVVGVRAGHEVATPLVKGEKAEHSKAIKSVARSG